MFRRLCRTLFGKFMAGRTLDLLLQLLLCELGHTCEPPGFVAFEGPRCILRSDAGAGQGQGMCLYVREELPPLSSSSAGYG